MDHNSRLHELIGRADVLASHTISSIAIGTAEISDAIDV
jgi:hypothetical protein